MHSPYGWSSDVALLGDQTSRETGSGERARRRSRLRRYR